MLDPIVQDPAAAGPPTPLLDQPGPVLAVLLGVLAVLFAGQQFGIVKRIYKILPMLLFCYFVPTALSNTGVIPKTRSFELYKFVTDWLLPASLVLLILAVDIPAILRLGWRPLALFLTAVVTITIGGPLAMLAFGWLLDPETLDSSWRGLAALCGSWIGGGANFTAIGESVGATDEMLGVMIVVDVAVANIWMAFLLYFAGNHEAIDAKIGANTQAVDDVQEKAEAYAAQISRPTDLVSLMAIAAIAFATTWGADFYGKVLAAELPENDIVNAFTWKIVLATTVALGLSFTPFRRLEGAGASKVGSVFLYLLVATIGAKASFDEVFSEKNIPLVAIGAVWMLFHALSMLWVRRRLKAPIFFAAVGSKSCVGGAASAPIVAAAFNPALAPVGVLLAILGYVCGTFGGITCASLLKWAAGFYGAS